MAFHVLRAIKARASGTRTAVLNLRPKRKGIMTFLTNFERPVTASGTLTSSCTKDLGTKELKAPPSRNGDGTLATKR